MDVLNIDISDLNYILNEQDVSSNENIISFETLDNQPSDSYSHFFKEFLIKNQPCLIVDCASSWNSRKQWTINGKPNFDYLKTKFGSAKVPVSNCKIKYFNAHETERHRFMDFIDYWKQYINENYPSSEPCWYLKDWHFMQDFPSELIYFVPYQFSSDWLNEYYVEHPNLGDDYRFVYMGPKGSWTPFHADVFTSFSWSANICGKKKWLFFPPGEENSVKDNLGNLAHDVTVANNNNEKTITVIQEPGEVIFVPSGWHHQVWNEDDTISINHNWINACNITQVWNSLQTNLEEVKKEVADCQDMENWTEHCQLMLKSTFGMNYEEFYTFLYYIGNKRLEHLNENKLLETFNAWKFGKEHLIFDLIKIKEVLLLLIDCDKIIELPFYFELEKPPEYFINDINNVVNLYLEQNSSEDE